MTTSPAETITTESPPALRAGLETVLARYEEARSGEPFGREHPLWETFRALRDEVARLPAVTSRPTLEVGWSAGGGQWARVPWVALLDTRETRTPRRGLHVAFLFRQDLSGVYLVLTQGIVEPRRQLGAVVARATLRRRADDLRGFCRDLPARGFAVDDLLDLRLDDAGLERDYEASVVAYRFYEVGDLPGDDVLAADVEAVLDAYGRYLRARRARTIVPSAPSRTARVEGQGAERWDRADALARVVEAVGRRGFVFEPWQVAAYVTALRTKPFVILAGVSGTGKSRLPALVAQATGGQARLVPVRPDWTDSAEALGYTDLAGHFRPGAVLEAAREAGEHPGRHHVCVLDEMNLARPEHFFAEVLSRMEARESRPAGGFGAGPLLPSQSVPPEWRETGLPPNLALVGTVNMDESAHGFSRKVLDRAFTLELSDVDLARWAPADGEGDDPPQPERWPVRAWYPRAASLGGLEELTDAERARIEEAVAALEAANRHLAPAGLQAGYRTRDELALFVLHAAETDALFTGRDGMVDPLDLGLLMKILPRVAGGSGAVRRATLGLLGWAHGTPLRTEGEARGPVEAWEDAGRPGAVDGARYPRTAARLCMMWERLLDEGFTSFWA